MKFFLAFAALVSAAAPVEEAAPVKEKDVSCFWSGFLFSKSVSRLAYKL